MRTLLPWLASAKAATRWSFFNNDTHGRALFDALDLLDLLGEPPAARELGYSGAHAR